MAFNGDDDQLIRRILPTVLSAARQVASATAWGTLGTPVESKLIPGTIGTGVAPGGSTSVRLDPDVNSISAQNITGQYLQAADRVMVLCVPPHGVFIAYPIGSIIGGRELLIDQRADGVASSWTFTIPQTYRDLEYRFEWGPAVSASQDIWFQFNGDTSGIYTRSITYRGYGGVSTAFDANNETQAAVGNGYLNDRYVISQGLIADYRGALRKVISIDSTTADASPGFSEWGSVHWPSSAAVATLTIGSGGAPFAGSRFRIWGAA